MIILVRLRHRFRGRASEWFCAANMALWGAILLHPSETFTSPAYAGFTAIGEDRTGWLVGLLGLAWIVGLIVNGSMERTTSAIRSVCAFLGAIVYGFLAIGFAAAFWADGYLSTGVSTYGLMSLLALYSLYWIMRDRKAGEFGKADV